MITLTTEILRDYDQASTREWLETNGIGGFACATVTGSNARRYHALLTAAMRPPAGRVVLLSKLEETVLAGNERFDLSTNRYSGAIHPRGYQYLEEFRLDPFPVATFAFGGTRIEKTIFMVHGQNTTVVRYRVTQRQAGPLLLEIRPLIAFRDYHSLTHENSALDRSLRTDDPRLTSLKPYADQPELFLAHDAAEIDTQGFWYRNFEYSVEQERGLDCLEDLFNPMAMRFDLTQRDTIHIIASTVAQNVDDAEAFRAREIDRRARLTSGIPAEEELTRTLAAAADQFIVARGDQKTVIAGYPWFTDWGRDTMIALPGLTLSTGRPEIARSILLEFSRHVDQGMLPNRFPDAGEIPEYNTIDATLWYFEAVRAFLQHTSDEAFVIRQLYPVLCEIVDWHLRGTRYGIVMDSDGLLLSSDPAVQLTWMDAKIGDWVVTPRNGKAVEIQALWYNALRTMEDIARRSGFAAHQEKYRVLAELAQSSFTRVFWNDESQCLYDTVAQGIGDATIRPNQIFAVSLTHSMLERERARKVVTAVQRELFTPYGLRSLPPSDSRYRGRYQGNAFERDSSYHQGPVWAWLLGPFIDGYLKVFGDGVAQRDEVRQWLTTFSTHLSEAGLGQVSEIFDGDAPHHPRGCFAQAWSVAEVLRTIASHRLELSPARDGLSAAV